MTIEEIVGARIRALRKDRGWTQDELAQRAGIAVQTISRAERGGALSIANIKRVGVALEVHPLELFADPGVQGEISTEVRRVVDLMQGLDNEAQRAVRQHVEIASRMATSRTDNGMGLKGND